MSVKEFSCDNKYLTVDDVAALMKGEVGSNLCILYFKS